MIEAPPDLYFKLNLMKHPRAVSAFVGTFFLLNLMVLPSPVKAEETFTTTVKIVGYQQLLSGLMFPTAEGSGTIISEDGLVLTNSHVVFNDTLNKPLDGFSICVNESSQKPPACRFTATLQQMDQKVDLALLKIDPSVAWGTVPTAFPFLTYLNEADPKEAEAVTIKGFSASGGVTLNTTQGQISGFEQFNGYQYLKTDADIDAGNSGGTMLDANGNFIGVPTYVVSYYETAGRALHINEVKKWLAQENTQSFPLKLSANAKILADLKRLNESQTSQKLTYKTPPGLALSLPEGWIFQNITDDGFLIIQQNDDQGYIQGRIQKELYKFDLTPAERLAKFREVIGSETYPEEETMTINGKSASHFWEENSYGSQHFISLPYGYHSLMLDYFIPKGEEEKIQKDIDAFLASLTFSTPDADNSAPQMHLDDPNYPFSIRVLSGWRIEKNANPEGGLAVAGRKIEASETLKIHYGELPVGEPQNTPEEGLAYDLDNYVPYEAKVTFKSSKLVLDGLKGWIIFYEYSTGGQKKNVASVTVLDPQYEFYFDYEAEESVFEKGLPGFLYALKQFKSKRYDSPDPAWADLFNADQRGVYKIPERPTTANVRLTDITNHRFEQSILNLVDMGIIHGNPDGTFRPEDPVNRAASLKVILQGLRVVQELKEEAPYVMPENFNVFPDVSSSDWYATYVAEGLSNKIIAGYPDGTFKGAEKVNLAEALKMGLEAYDIKIWEGETEPWYKKYWDTALELDFLPRGLDQPEKFLTRAELAYIVDKMIEHVTYERNEELYF